MSLFDWSIKFLLKKRQIFCSSQIKNRKIFSFGYFYNLQEYSWAKAMGQKADEKNKVSSMLLHHLIV
jgi:hypothetical protein